MDRLKTFLKYALWVIGLFILSEIIATIGLNSDYIDIDRKDEIPQINIYQAQACTTNGRIRGVVTNEGEEEFKGRYMEFNFYSEKDRLIGRRYVYIPANVERGQTEPFELIFKFNNVSYYEVKMVDEKKDGAEINIDIIPKSWSNPLVKLTKMFLVLMFM